MPDNQQERNPRYSWVFHELTKDDGEENDLVSYIAYCLYKQRKVDFFKSKGGSPTQQEVESFNSVYLIPSQLDGLRNEAEKILTDVLNNIYSEKVKDVERSLESSFAAELIRKIDTFMSTIQSNHSLLDTEVKASFSSLKTLVDTSKDSLENVVGAKITALETKVNLNHATIDQEIKEFNKRDGWYWTREIIKGAGITVVATLFVWGISYALIGKALLGKFENDNVPAPSTQTQSPP